MDLISMVGIGLALAMDATAVAISSSILLGKVTLGQILRPSLSFGLFQAFMPLLGWLAGRSLNDLIQRWDHWVALGLLLWIGSKSIWESLPSASQASPNPKDPTQGLTLLMLSIATSIDALAVGLSFGLLEISIWLPCFIIGCITALLSALGMIFGRMLGALLGLRVRMVGGFILIGIGFKILWEHLQ